MRQLGFFAVAVAVAVASAAAWLASSTDAQVRTRSSARVDPMQMMTEQRYVPTEWMVDFSLVFEPTPDGATAVETPSK